MAIVSYRIHCEDCSNEQVIKEREMDEHVWVVSSKVNHAGLCPSCNETIQSDEDDKESQKEQRVPFETFDNIGVTGAENLREAGIVSREDTLDATDEEILSVSWVGEGGLKSIRREVR
jgi:hypothetical protein